MLLDRGSQLEHLGITFPVLRRRVKEGFSFSRDDPAAVLEIWNHLWMTSPIGEVLFAAIEFYAPVVRKSPSPELWPVMRNWPVRVDNWCHADGLCGLYSRLLQADVAGVFPQLEAWNAEDSVWLRRISLVSLIHYSGRHAVFLPPETVLPMAERCLDDHRHYVQTAVGWVLREMARQHPDEIMEFLEGHARRLGSKAFARAVEGLPVEERERLRCLRT
ncbi:MAG: hypothetical protein HONBIEJF_00967 [Fimbriimonadaceae bacterium]|nr:hypothetical protein [Fimbriimonadaceae bacterium]